MEEDEELELGMVLLDVSVTVSSVLLLRYSSRVGGCFSLVERFNKESMGWEGAQHSRWEPG